MSRAEGMTGEMRHPEKTRKELFIEFRLSLGMKQWMQRPEEDEARSDRNPLEAGWTLSITHSDCFGL